MQTKTLSARFAICISARPEEDLVVGKVYHVIADKSAADVAGLRVVDESGEDYLYAASRFVMLNVPQAERVRLLKAMKRRSASLAGN